MKFFRKLYPHEIEVRIAQVSKDGKKASVLLYKTARTDADILDETVGPERWMNDFKVIDGVLYGGIGVAYGDGPMVWKWDAGTESNMQEDKGRASDAFKRAGFKHGIGRELYSAPTIWVPIDSKYDKFYCSDIDYDENERISMLVIRNAKTDKVVFSCGEPAKRPAASADKEPEEEAKQECTCARCGKPVTPVEIDGKTYSVKKILDCGKKRFGPNTCLCYSCLKVLQDASKSA